MSTKVKVPKKRVSVITKIILTKKTKSNPNLKKVIKKNNNKLNHKLIVRLASMTAVMIIVFGSLFLKTLSINSTYASSQLSSLRVYPLEVKTFTTAQRNAFTRTMYSAFTTPSASSQAQAVDAARPQKPSWDPSSTLTADVSEWTGINYVFDLSSIKSCMSTTSSATVRQHGSYVIKPASDNRRNTQYNDVNQVLNMDSASVETQYVAGNRAKGSTTTVTIDGDSRNIAYRDISRVGVGVLVQSKEAGTGIINTSVDDIWLDVTYQNNCTTSPTGRYESIVYPDNPVTYQNVVYSSPINYLGQLEPQTMDIYTPQGDVSNSRPLLVFIHGGAFIDGSKEDQANDAIYYAKMGYTTATINYRLRPGIYNGVNNPPFDQVLPAIRDALTDTKEAVKFLKQNRSIYKIDSNRVAVLGWSAGGITALSNYLSFPDDNVSSQFRNTASTVSAISSLSGELPIISQPAMIASLPSVQMVNYEIDPSVEWYPNDTLTPIQTCQTIRAAGAVCEQHTMSGLGHIMTFVDQKDRVIPFLKTYLNL